MCSIMIGRGSGTNKMYPDFLTERETNIMYPDHLSKEVEHITCLMVRMKSSVIQCVDIHTL